MSALMTPRRSRRSRGSRPAGAGGQPALFGAGSAPSVAAPPAAPGMVEAIAVEVPAVPAPAPVEAAAPAAEAAAPAVDVAAPAAEAAPTASAHRHGPTLDDLVAGAWEGLVAGALADCLVCGAPMAPRHSAGAGIVGGRCGGCGTTVS